MNVQDKLERILREMHIMVSRGPTLENDSDFVLIHKKDMQRLLGGISQAVSEMMEQYEITEQSRNRAELEAEKHRMEIIRNANRQAEDIYAASVMYTDDALGRIQDIIEEAEKSAKEILHTLNRSMEEEKRLIRTNQLELKTQLEDMKDTAKYIKLIEERNREIAKAKNKKTNDEKERRYQRTEEKDEDFVPITPEIKINEEYFEKAGLTPEGLPKDMEEESGAEETAYEKPVIKINEEYFEKAGIPYEKEEEKDTEDKPEDKEETSKEETVDETPPKENDAENADGPLEELTPEMEEKLKEELDMEYFEWRKGDKPEEKKEKRKGLFSFGRKS